jgi:hypothetical protein
MMDADRAKLQIAAVVGAVFGILTGYVVGHPPFGILIWGLIGAVVGAVAVYVIGHFGNASAATLLEKSVPRNHGLAALKLRALGLAHFTCARHGPRCREMILQRAVAPDGPVQGRWYTAVIRIVRGLSGSG